MNYLDKEFHPIIEDFISDYVDDTIDEIERSAFDEVMVHDDDIRELVYSAKKGKNILEQFREINAREGFLERLLSKIS